MESVNLELLAHKIKMLEKAESANISAHERIFKQLDGTTTDNLAQFKIIEGILQLHDQKMSQIKELLSLMRTDMETIKAKPRHRYDLIVTTIITASIMGLIGYIITAGLN